VAGCKKPEVQAPLKNPNPSPAERLKEGSTVAATNSFGFDLLRRLDAEQASQTGNVFISPFSIMQAMTLVTNGAGGETQSELLGGLHLAGIEISTVNQEQKALRGMLASTKQNSENSLQIANAIWVDQGLKLAPDFVNTARDFYGAPAKTLNFSDTTGAANTINQWVKTNTRGKIETLFTGEELAGQTPVVLANAVYFKAAWRTPFSEADTSPKPFTLESGLQKTLPMMQQANMTGLEDGVSYYKGDGFAMASLLYDSEISHSSRSMVFLLPDTSDGLNSLVSKMTPENWKAWHKKSTPIVEMDLWLPRFTLSYEAPLMKPLSQMGIRRAFGREADFGRMGLETHCITLIKHKTFLSVDEKGTEAAAVTGVGMPGAAAPAFEIQKVVFHVDRPFICAIVDDATGAILFVGVIRNPVAAD
jgi:serine protease inhibitor